jgi:hypothetical protein
MIKRKRFAVPVISFFMILFTLGGCSTSNFGRLESDKEVKRSFESYQVLPNHNYYYYGTSSSPAAIVGIEENYELNLTMWVKLDTESDNYRRLIDIVSIQGAGRTVHPWGFRILDKAGNYVGVWYSAARASSVNINDNRQIVDFGPFIVVRGEDHR